MKDISEISEISENSVFLKEKEIYRSPTYYNYILLYIILFPVFLCIFNMYVLDFYFFNKVILNNLNILNIHLWLEIDAVLGLSFFTFYFIYYNLYFYEDLYPDKFFKKFYITLSLFSLCLIGWTTAGWILFYRYPTIPSTKYNIFHIKMWIHLSLQSILYIYTFFRYSFLCCF